MTKQQELFSVADKPAGAFACTGRVVNQGVSDGLADVSDAASSHISAVAMDVARRYGRVSADDLHDPALLQDRDGRVIGAVLRSLVKAGALKPDGYFPSARAESHHRPIQRFIPA